MKNLLKITTIALVFTLFSCGGPGAPSMNTKDGLEKIKSNAIENFGGDFEVFSISLLSHGDLSSELHRTTVNYLKDGKRYSRDYYENNVGKMSGLAEEKVASDAFQSERNLKNAHGKMKISDIDTSQIKSNIEMALVLMGDDVNKHELRSYDISVDPKTNAVTARFKLNVTQKGEGTTVEGRNIVTNFYEANFKADADGNVEMTD